LVTGTYSEYRFWEVGSWQKRHALPREKGTKTVGWIVFSPDGKMLAVLHGVSQVHLVDPATGREFARLPTSGGPYGFSPDGSHLVTCAGRDGAFQVWDLRLIRRQLREMGLDWDLPPYPPAAEAAARPGAGRRAEAVHAYSQAIERNPQEAEAYHWRAHARERLGWWEEAIDDHSRAIQRAPQRRDFLVCRGRCYLRTGQVDKAAPDLRAAQGRNAAQKNEVAWWLVTASNPVHREPALAVELAKQVVRQAPREAVYWKTLGVAHYRSGEWQAALGALEEAEKRAPGKNFGFNAFFLAMCHHQLGDPAKAKDHYDRAVRWHPEDPGNLDSAQQQELEALHAEAEALLKRPRHGP
jgi:tetratricopeptide (TPR) repeat protein